MPKAKRIPALPFEDFFTYDEVTQFVEALAKSCPDLETIVPLDRLVSEYNANAERVPRLWARAKIKLTVPMKIGIPYAVVRIVE